MDHITRNVIDWNRNAARRATRRHERARSSADRHSAAADIARHRANIELLEGKAR